MKIKAVIFDLDGVIVTTDELHYKAWKFMADQEGITFNKEINNRLRGVSRMESLNIILEKAEKEYSIEQKNALAKLKNDYYIELLQELNSDSILPGVLDVIEELKNRKILMAIGSSSRNTPLILKQIGLDKTFDAIADGNDIENSKPHPEVFLLAAKKLKIKPKNCVVIEDAEAGIVAAIRANMVSVAVGDATKSLLADYKLFNIKDLLNIV